MSSPARGRALRRWWSPIVDDPRLLTALMMLLALTGFGTLGYRYIEGCDWIDSLYMTVITLSTVGFREVVLSVMPASCSRSY